ncbi:hypothetical protein [Acinetobacter boissieri]|uniref:Type IV pilus assembly protein PilY1 n=1 Tax=Acinetobacter boissieri TaxID=1219383 RepID=A0A1G6HZU5_9GAMM|nr:hypothetical protein [Acinetobacter boissieri]SDB99734.1 type IV pilus assembly protein PilY1 [Acinetobacter boissieri]
MDLSLNKSFPFVLKQSRWISCVCMMLGIAQTSYASDIEIYQTGTTTPPTLMFLLDISGSMTSTFGIRFGYTSSYCSNNPSNAYCSIGISACDIPSGYQFTAFESDASTTDRPYTRNYCSAVSANNMTYFFKRLYVPGEWRWSGRRWYWVSDRYDYYSCGSAGSSSQDACTSIVGAPSANVLASYNSSSNGNATYYFKYNAQKFYDRITKVKDGMFDLLQGSSTVSRLSNDKIIGLSAFSYRSDNSTGYIVVPARPLNTSVSSNKDQRATLLAEIANLTAGGGTPTAHAYAETAAYLMGTTTFGATYSGFNNSTSTAKNSSTQYRKPDSLNQDNAQCTGQGIYVLTDGQPNASSSSAASNIMQTSLTSSYRSMLNCSASPLAAGSDDSGWACIGSFSQLLLDKNKNPLGRSIKTAVVGFGGEFSGLTSYSPSLTQQQNIDNIDNSSASVSVKNAAKWGVYAKGGWYAGSKASDIVSSVNMFITNTSGDIPPVTTGAATVPIDNLNPLALRNNAYFSQFQPTPDKNYQLWLGNLKKYVVDGGFLKDQNKNNIQNGAGEIISNYDFWARSSSDLVGGVTARLPLGVKNDSEFNRVVWTDRKLDLSTDGVGLRKLGLDDLNNGSDADRGYLLSLLGFNIDLKNLPRTMNDLKNTAELRQMGALLHSSPLLLTNEGIIQVDNNKVVTKERADYIVFGSTQGLLHVVDATTGIEKFAFMPNELAKTQKEAFARFDTTSGGVGSLFYGIDAPWTNYTEYVTKDSSTGKVTVGNGENSTTGKQIIYGGLRMGGRSYYAIDLKDMDAPSILFHISPEDKKVFSQSQTVSDKTYPELDFMGQSWAKPTTAWVNWQNKKRLVMFVSGGYDAGGDDGDGEFDYSAGKRGVYSGYESAEYEQRTKKGAGVYMFDALTGELLWWAGANATANNTSSTVKYSNVPDMKYSVVSQIRTVDRNLDGLVDHLYFGDLGGQVWRIDINNNAPDSNLFAKPPVRLMNLNNGKYSPRFYDMPAFSVYKKDNQLFTVISIGAGNRSSPMFNTADGNYKDDAIYNIYDKDVVKNRLFNLTKNNEGNYVYTDVDGLNSQNATLTSSNIASRIVPMGDTNVQTAAGWFYGFKTASLSTLQTEKVTQIPIVVSNDMYVTTFNNTQNGVSGLCGSGVKGKSYVSLFCMPYGQCSGGVKRNEIGAGLVSPSVASPTADGYDRSLVSTVASVLNGSTDNPFRQYRNNQKIIPKNWVEVGQ